MKDIESWSKDQNRLNWSLAVQMANNWRRMMGVKEVNYPYPEIPGKGYL